jgi:thiol-disulfide isomerase/thioredoxin
MSRITAAGPSPKRPPHSELELMLRVVIGKILFSGLLVGLLGGGPALATKGNAKASQPASKALKLSVIDRSHAGEMAPPIAFEAKGGKVTSVAALLAAAHKPVLVNLWATWCVPCRAEMPELDVLAKARASSLTVLPISEDLEGWRAVDKYFVAGKFAALVPYLDQPGNYAVKMGATGLPLSILYGADGREKWRVNGPLKWNSAEVAAALG